MRCPRGHVCAYQEPHRMLSRLRCVLHPHDARAVSGTPSSWPRPPWDPTAQLANIVELENEQQQLKELLEQTLREEVAARTRRQQLEERLRQLASSVQQNVPPTQPESDITPSNSDPSHIGRDDRPGALPRHDSSSAPAKNVREYSPSALPVQDSDSSPSQDGRDDSPSALPGYMMEEVGAPDLHLQGRKRAAAEQVEGAAVGQLQQHLLPAQPLDGHGSSTQSVHAQQLGAHIASAAKLTSQWETTASTSMARAPAAVVAGETAATTSTQPGSSSSGAVSSRFPNPSPWPISSDASSNSRSTSSPSPHSLSPNSSSDATAGAAAVGTSAASTTANITPSGTAATSSSPSTTLLPTKSPGAATAIPSPSTHTHATSSMPHSSSRPITRSTLRTRIGATVPHSSTHLVTTTNSTTTAESNNGSTNTAPSSSTAAAPATQSGSPSETTIPTPIPRPFSPPPIEGMYSVRLPPRTSQQTSTESGEGVWGGVVGYMGETQLWEPGSTPAAADVKSVGARMGVPKLATASNASIPAGPTPKRRLKKKSKRYEAMAAAAGASKVIPITPDPPPASSPLSPPTSLSLPSPGFPGASAFTGPSAPSLSAGIPGAPQKLQDSLDLIASKMGDLAATMDSSFDMGEQMWVSPWTPKDKQENDPETCLLPKPIYIISDCTGESAARTVRAALGQFEGFAKRSCPAHLVVFRFVNSERNAMRIIEHAQREDALVVYTLVDSKLVKTLATSARLCGVRAVDLWSSLLTAMEEHLDAVRSGLPLGDPDRKSITLSEDYFRMIEAVEFTRKMDDGANPQCWKDADLLILGVSRSGKTPLSIYLGQRGYKVANLPLVPDCPLPRQLFEMDQSRIVALIIDAQLLARVRKQRNLAMGVGEDANTDYSAVRKVQAELDWARRLYGEHPEWPVLDVTFRGVEETAARILRIMAERRGNVSPMWVEQYNRQLLGATTQVLQ